MNILFLGDISGSPGRETVAKILPNLIKKYNIDLTIANVENSAGGRGVNKKILKELESYGIDYATAGEHIWDQKEFPDELLEDSSLSIIRPLNYEADLLLPGFGYKIIDMGKTEVIIVCMLGQTFMKEPVRSPFWRFDEWWEYMTSEGKINPQNPPVIILDFHAEATSEKISLAWYLKDKISALIGTHTHVATCDHRILDDKCAFVTDVGMCGPYDASLWVDFDSVINNFRFPIKKSFVMEKKGKKIFNSVLLKFKNNKILEINRIDHVLES